MTTFTIPFSGGANVSFEVYVLQLLGARVISRAEAREALGIEGDTPSREAEGGIDTTERYLRTLESMDPDDVMQQRIDRLRESRTPAPVPSGESYVEIGGQRMTEAQFNAARRPLLDGVASLAEANRLLRVRD